MKHRASVALALLFLPSACEPADPPQIGAHQDSAAGRPRPGSTPPPGPVCRGPTVIENNASSPWGIEPALTARSLSYGPAIDAHSQGTTTGSFRSAGLTLEARTSAPGAPALRATANAANGVGVHARVVSPAGVPMRVTATGGAHLLHAGRAGEQNPRFWINYRAEPVSNGITITEYGPKGNDGADGADGPTGARGTSGAPGHGVTFALCSDDNSCMGQCTGGWIAVEADAPCQVGADFGGCNRAGNDGVCCVCGT